jgi:hypothetical protein
MAVEEPTLEEAKKICGIFKDEFEKPRNDQDNLQIARHLILLLIKRVEVLEERVAKMEPQVRQSAMYTTRYR